MKKLLPILISLIFFGCDSTEKKSQEEFIASLEKKFSLNNMTVTNENSLQKKDQEAKEKKSFYLTNKTSSNTIGIYFHTNKDNIIRMLSMFSNVGPNPYDKKVTMFSDYEYYDCRFWAVDKENCSSNFRCYYENYYFKIDGNKKFIDEAVYQISQELKLLY